MFDKIKSRFNNSNFYQWNILFNLNTKSSTSFSEFRELIPPKDRFWADPFVIFQDKNYYVFFEECLFQENIGHISFLKIDMNGNYTKPQIVLKKPYHISYPFIFRFKDDLYMTTESCANNQTDIFQCTNFPFEWKFYTTILPGRSLVDPTLFQHKGKWWLFAGKGDNDGTSKSDELLLYFSDSPFSENWNEHPMNPIITDIKKARPAGKISFVNGKLIRPGQNCHEVYGNGFSFNEIIRLTENEYEEKQIQVFSSNWKEDCIGLHTFNYEQGCTVVDTRVKRKKD